MLDVRLSQEAGPRALQGKQNPDSHQADPGGRALGPVKRVRELGSCQAKPGNGAPCTPGEGWRFVSRQAELGCGVPRSHWWRAGPQAHQVGGGHGQLLGRPGSGAPGHLGRGRSFGGCRAGPRGKALACTCKGQRHCRLWIASGVGARAFLVGTGPTKLPDWAEGQIPGLSNRCRGLRSQGVEQGARPWASPAGGGALMAAGLSQGVEPWAPLAGSGVLAVARPSQGVGPGTSRQPVTRPPGQEEDRALVLCGVEWGSSSHSAKPGSRAPGYPSGGAGLWWPLC